MRDIESSRRRAGRRALVVAACAAATLLIAPGLAQAQLPGEPGAVDQYVEDVPAGGGKEHPGTGDPSTTSLPADVADQIASEGGSDAPLLEELATSSAYGAPQSSLRNTSPGTGDGDREASEAEGGSGVFSSAFTAVEGGDSKRLLGLLLALLAISVATIVAVAARQRRSDGG